MLKIDRGVRRGTAMLLAAGCLSLATIGPVAAATYVQEDTFSFLDVLSNLAPGTYTGSVQHVIDSAGFGFDLFNPAFGTLTAARWEIESAFFGEATAHVVSTSTQPSAIVAGKLTFGIGVQTEILRGTSARFSGLKFASGECSAVASCDIGLTGLNGIGEILDDSLVADDLAALSGVGFFFVTLDMVGELTNEILAGPGDMESSGAYQWAGAAGLGTLRLIYEYNNPSIVPEPSTLVLLGGALAWLGVRIRRPLL